MAEEQLIDSRTRIQAEIDAKEYAIQTWRWLRNNTQSDEQRSGARREIARLTEEIRRLHVQLAQT